MDIINKTYELIDTLDNSDLFKDLTIYKEKIMNNKELRELIDVSNNETDKYKLLGLKQELYKYEEYIEYNRIYNEIMYIVMNINSRFKSLFNNERKCSKWKL